MGVRKRRPASTRFHAEGWHPALAAATGALGFAAMSVAVLAVLLRFSDSPFSASWAFPVFVTAIVTGGVAGLTLKNLNLSRAESRRSLNLMFDEQLRAGAQLLGGSSESEVIAGAQALGLLLRESPRHAQVCADLLCERLRAPHPSDVHLVDGDHVPTGAPEGLAEAAAEANRIRNALADAIARAIKSEGAPDHLESIAWRFEYARFGDRTRFEACTFGRESHFRRSTFNGDVSLAGSRFESDAQFAFVSAPQGLFLRGIRVGGRVVVENATIRNAAGENAWGIYLEGSEAAGVVIERCIVDGSIHLDTSHIEGDVRVLDSEATSFSFIDGRCDRWIDLDRLITSRYICVRNTAARKGVSVHGCSANDEIEVSGVTTLGEARVTESSAPSVLR